MRPYKSYEGEEKYIFISYAHKDSEKVFPIIRTMQDAGFRIWYDDGIEPGNEWDEAIAEHIQKAAVMLAFISDNYMASKNCKDELNFARDEDINHILIYLEDTELPAGIKMRVGRQQAIHYFRYKDNKEEFYEKLFHASELKGMASQDIIQPQTEQPVCHKKIPVSCSIDRVYVINSTMVVDVSSSEKLDGYFLSVSVYEGGTEYRELLNERISNFYLREKGIYTFKFQLVQKGKIKLEIIDINDSILTSKEVQCN